MTLHWIRWTRIPALLLLCLAACDGGGPLDQPPTDSGGRPPRAFRMSLTTFGPGTGEEVRRRTFDFVRANADLIALHYDDRELPWESLDAGSIPGALRERVERDARDAEGEAIYVAVTPLNQARSEVVGDSSGGPFPASLGPGLFSNPRLRGAFVTYARFVRDALDPRYMAVGIEVNLYALGNPADFQHLVTLYKETYRALKGDDPTLVVFPTWQHEFLIGTSQETLLERFEPELDRLALATYPSSAGFTPSRIPGDYLSRLRGFSRRPIVISETGYGSRPYDGTDFDAPGSPSLQREYLEWLVDRAEEESMDFFVWFFPTDIPEVVDQLPPDDSLRFFGFMGLTASGFQPRDVTTLWREHLARTFAPD